MADVTPKKRWMPVVLGISLALNLAVIAAISGAALRHKGGEKKGPRPGSGGVIYMQALPHEMQKELRQSLRKGEGHKRPDTAEMVAILRLDPFDAAAAVRVLEAERSGSLARIEAVSAAWLSKINEMSVEERGSYADRLEELSERRKKRWKDRKGGSKTPD